jgi:cytochrome P450
MATATYPDGSVPEVLEVAKPATFLFAAGQETVTKLLSAAVQTLGDRPELQQVLREDRALIPAFIEESLRLQSPTKVDFRLARKTTSLAGVPIPAGTVLMLCLGAANRDPRKFDDPHEFRLNRKNVREHIAFGRGIHTCAGAPLARVEGRITVHRLLDRMRDITISQSSHGPVDQRRYSYEPTFLLRGLTELHIEFSPVRDPRVGANTEPTIDRQIPGLTARRPDRSPQLARHRAGRVAQGVDVSGIEWPAGGGDHQADGTDGLP